MEGKTKQSSQIRCTQLPAGQWKGNQKCLRKERKLAEGVLDPNVEVIDKDVYEHQSHVRPIGHTIHHWPPHGHRTANHNPPGVTIQPIFFNQIVYPSNFFPQFRDKNGTMPKALQKSG